MKSCMKQQMRHSPDKQASLQLLTFQQVYEKKRLQCSVGLESHYSLFWSDALGFECHQSKPAGVEVASRALYLSLALPRTDTAKEAGKPCWPYCSSAQTCNNQNAKLGGTKPRLEKAMHMGSGVPNSACLKWPAAHPAIH